MPHHLSLILCHILFHKSRHLRFGLPRCLFPPIVIRNTVLVVIFLSRLCTCPINLNPFPMRIADTGTKFSFSHMHTLFISTTIGGLSPDSVFTNPSSKFDEKSARALPILQLSPRKFVYAHIFPIRYLWTARFLRLSFAFTTKNHQIPSNAVKAYRSAHGRRSVGDGGGGTRPPPLFSLVGTT